MDNKLTQDYKKVAKNTISYLKTRITNGEDFIKFFAFFKCAYNTRLINKAELEEFATALIDCEVEKKALESIAPLKDYTCKILANIMADNMPSLKECFDEYNFHI